jgi:tetratricopeptide (TPR) repeat protein
MSEKQEFPDVHWDDMRREMESYGAASVVEFIRGFDDATERLKLYQFAQQAFGGREWEGKNFDDLIALVNAGIEEGIAQSDNAENEDVAAKRKDFANVLSFNLSADLAECWPGDEAPREQRHFAAGQKAAEDCIRWREELGKGPFPFALAYWAKGAHQTSLGDYQGAVDSFRKAFEFGKKAAVVEGNKPTIDADGGFVPILNYGYLGLAKRLAGDEGGAAMFDEACAAFEQMIEKHEDKKDDARFGIDQLKWFESKVVNK